MFVSGAAEKYIRHITIELGYSPATTVNYQNRLRYLNNMNEELRNNTKRISRCSFTILNKTEYREAKK